MTGLPLWDQITSKEAIAVGGVIGALGLGLWAVTLGWLDPAVSLALGLAALACLAVAGVGAIEWGLHRVHAPPRVPAGARRELALIPQPRSRVMALWWDVRRHAEFFPEVVASRTVLKEGQALQIVDDVFRDRTSTHPALTKRERKGDEELLITYLDGDPKGTVEHWVLREEPEGTSVEFWDEPPSSAASAFQYICRRTAELR